MVMMESSSNIKKMSHLPLIYSILLWSIYAGRLMNNPLLLEKTMQVIIEIIFCIINSKFLYRRTKLSGNHFAKIGQDSTNCSFLF